MEAIIEAIMNRLADKVPELNFIDIDLEQLQLSAPPVDFPCALIDVATIDYSSNSGNSQQALATINVTLGFNILSVSDANAPATTRAQSMAHYKIIEKVAEALHGFGTQEFSSLQRIKLQRRANTYPRHYVMSFQTQFTESFN